MHTINVAIEEYIGPFPASTTGRTWNGWECPHFTFDVACDVALAIIESGSIAGYSPERDAFFTLDHSNGTDVDSWSAANASEGTLEDPDVMANSQMEVAPGVYLDFWTRESNATYPIGAMSWVWDDCTPVLARAFANALADELEPADWDAMLAKNATPAYAGSVCASHEYCDANEPMSRAFFLIFGREADPSRETDSAAWNAAWALAKTDYLTARS
jgi:hypothetical protein